jgi:hypothetical protein
MAAVSAGSVIAAASAAIATAGASADASAVCAVPLKLLAVTGSGSWGLGLLVPAAAASCLQWKDRLRWNGVGDFCICRQVQQTACVDHAHAHKEQFALNRV